jgi:hypothetical protein
VAAARPLAPARQREIDAGERCRGLFEALLALCDRAFELTLEGIRGRPDLFACIGVESGKGFQDFSEGTSLAAQELDLELLEPAFVGVRDLFETLPQRF